MQPNSFEGITLSVHSVIYGSIAGTIHEGTISLVTPAPERIAADAVYAKRAAPAYSVEPPISPMYP